MQSGILRAKFISKNQNIIPKIDEFPGENNIYLDFDIYKQKLSFTSFDTYICEAGCFLLITYYPKISESLQIQGTEFSILSRILDENDPYNQIINIPLNEYIFGFFDGAINIHYYSLFVPFETDNIYIEIHGKNILGFSQKGIIKIKTNIESITDDTKILFNEFQNRMIIKLNKKDIELDSFKGEYISFAFKEEFPDFYSYYYFRVLQQRSENNYIIYPLDTNKENYCQKINNKCYFLMKNDYHGLSNTNLIYSFGAKNISYKVYYMNDTDYYSTDLNLDNLNETKEIISFNNYLSFDMESDENYALILIESNLKENENLIVESSLCNQSFSSSIDIYSYQQYHLYENQYQQFNLIENTLIGNYRIIINNIEGEGFFCYNEICDEKNKYSHLKGQKIYSFKIPDEAKFFIYALSNLTYNIKVIINFSSQIIKELKYDYNIEELNEQIFPLIYLIKDVNYNGMNINFHFKLNNPNQNDENINLIIKGYTLDYLDIFSITDKFYIKNFNNPNEIGKYDNITNSGTIELSNDLIKTKYNETYKYAEDTEDKYFMIIIDNITSHEIKNLSNNIYVISKDENYILLPINQYIRNSFRLLKNKTIMQKYFFKKEINNYYFIISIKPTNQLNLTKTLKEINIIIKYYNEKEKINNDYIWKKNFKLGKIKKNVNCSDYNLIISNINEIKNYSNGLNYIYYLRLIKKKNALINEELNTTASISSNLSYINKYYTINPNEEFLFNLKNLENNEIYIASFFIKVKNETDEEESYYSMTYEIRTESEKSLILILIIGIALIIFLIIIITIFISFCKKRNKKRKLINKVNNISFSTEINEDILNETSDNLKNDEDKDQYFI